jgi:hypothetical protein
MNAQRMNEIASNVNGATLPISDAAIDSGPSALRSAVEDDGVSNGHALVR